MYGKMRKEKWCPFTSERPLRVGTDCSGMEAPIVALHRLGVPISHAFSSEINETCIRMIEANFAPKTIFRDMTKRKIKDIPDIDLYVCGFPCQPFSTAGKRLGEQDPRGTIFWECVRVLRSKRPLFFVLENVQGLLSIQKGETFRQMMKELHKIKGYHIESRVLNTNQYGIPQSRKRVFIVGKRVRALKPPTFSWPQAVPCPPMHAFVDHSDRHPEKWTDRTTLHVEKQRQHTPTLTFIDSTFFFPNRCMAKIQTSAPCINTLGGLLNVTYHRKANVREHLWLQGFFEQDFPNVTCSSLAFKRMLGNTMSVNVMAGVLKMLLES